MHRVLLLTVALCFPVLAQAHKEGPVRLALSPKNTPTPSLKYRLTPDPRTLKEGNAATLYYRTLAMFVENRALLGVLQNDSGHEWLDVPLEDLPVKEMRERVQQTRNFFAELERAAQYRQCDWRLHNREEGIGLLLPDIQGFRLLGASLAVRARLEIAEKKYADAVQTLQVGYTLAHHMSEGSSLVQVLVGIAIAQLMNQQLDTLIAQPDSPNLYWSLATSPRPMFDSLRAAEGETTMLESTWPWLKELNETPMSLYQVQEGLHQLDKSFHSFEFRTELTVAQRLARATLLAASHERAKKALIEAGFDKTKVEAMPSLQAVALWSFREYRESQDEVVKWLHLPQGIYHPQYEKAAQRGKAALEQFDRLFFRGLLTALGGADFGYRSVQEAIDRFARRRAAQMALEALRLHAARHGSWPESLAEIEDVIVLPDPVTQKPFEYKRVGDRASLVSPLHPNETENPLNRIHYELTLQK